MQIEELKITIKHLAVTGNDLEKDILELERKEHDVSGNLREYQIEFERVEEEKKKHEKEMLINEAKFKASLAELNELKSAQEKI